VNISRHDEGAIPNLESEHSQSNNNFDLLVDLDKVKQEDNDFRVIVDHKNNTRRTAFHGSQVLGCINIGENSFKVITVWARNSTRNPDTGNATSTSMGLTNRKIGNQQLN